MIKRVSYMSPDERWAQRIGTVLTKALNLGVVAESKGTRTGLQQDEVPSTLSFNAMPRPCVEKPRSQSKTRKTETPSTSRGRAGRLTHDGNAVTRRRCRLTVVGL